MRVRLGDKIEEGRKSLKSQTITRLGNVGCSFRRYQVAGTAWGINVVGGIEMGAATGVATVSRAWIAMPIELPMQANANKQTIMPMIIVRIGLSVHLGGSIEYLSPIGGWEEVEPRKQCQKECSVRLLESACFLLIESATTVLTVKYHNKIKSVHN